LHTADMDADAAAEDTYLFARTEFEHGHFKCNVQWEKVFTLHPRLRSSKNKLSSNRGEGRVVHPLPSAVY